MKWLHTGLASQCRLPLFEADEGMVDISSDLFLWNIITISLPIYLSREKKFSHFLFLLHFLCWWCCYESVDLYDWKAGDGITVPPHTGSTAPMPAVISSMGMWHSDKLPSCPCSLAPRSFIYPFSPICIVLFLLPSRSSCSVIGPDRMKICWMQMWNCRMLVHATLDTTHVVGKYKYNIPY